MLSEAEQDEIEAAIGRVEDKTTAEIKCVIAKSVSTYPEIVLAWAALGALLLPLALVWGLKPALLLDVAQGWRTSPSNAPEAVLANAISHYALLQIGLFLIFSLVLSHPSIRVAVTPKFWRRRRVHAAAFAQYLATGLHQNPSRTGVVIFACSEDRCVSIVTDDLIQRHVETIVWDRAVAAVLDGIRRNAPGEGFVRAIEICAIPLIQHFPGRSPDALADRPLEL